MDKLSTVMSKKTESHKNLSKSYKPPYKPYMTGPKWGQGRKNSLAPLALDELKSSHNQVILEVIEGHLEVETAISKAAAKNPKDSTRYPLNAIHIFPPDVWAEMKDHHYNCHQLGHFSANLSKKEQFTKDLFF